MRGCSCGAREVPSCQPAISTAVIALAWKHRADRSIIGWSPSSGRHRSAVRSSATWRSTRARDGGSLSAVSPRSLRRRSSCPVLPANRSSPSPDRRGRPASTRRGSELSTAPLHRGNAATLVIEVSGSNRFSGALLVERPGRRSRSRSPGRHDPGDALALRDHDNDRPKSDHPRDATPGPPGPEPGRGRCRLERRPHPERRARRAHRVPWSERPLLVRRPSPSRRRWLRSSPAGRRRWLRSSPAGRRRWLRSSPAGRRRGRSTVTSGLPAASDGPGCRQEFPWHLRLRRD